MLWFDHRNHSITTTTHPSYYFRYITEIRLPQCNGIWQIYASYNSKQGEGLEMDDNTKFAIH